MFSFVVNYEKKACAWSAIRKKRGNKIRTVRLFERGFHKDFFALIRFTLAAGSTLTA